MAQWMVAVLVLAPSGGCLAQASGMAAVKASATDALPLKAARVVRFRTNEGTWMSLDVSPDGRTIVFDLLDDLYTVPITGGRATAITSGLALNRQPRYSPDGQEIVFVSDRGGSENVWLTDRYGRHPRQLSDLHGQDGIGAVTSPTWSPDGQTIVVSQRLGATRLTSESQGWRWLLASYDVASGDMRWISDTASGRARSALGPTYAPNGRGLFAAVDAFRTRMAEELPEWRISLVDAMTGHVEPEMAYSVGRVGMRPLVSPNGRYLVYATSSGSHTGLRLRDLSTDRERWLVREVLADPPADESEPRDLVPGYAFTPNSNAVVAAYAGKIHRIDVATARSAVVPFVAQVERRLGPLAIDRFSLPDTAVRTHSVLQPALAPDGSWVAFSALDRIWLMSLPQDDRPAGQPRRLTADSVGEFYPSWSEDGRWIVYSTWMDGQGGGVRRARVAYGADGASVSERLTADTAAYFDTAVAPEGGRIVAVRAPVSPERMLPSTFPPMPLDLKLVEIPPHLGSPRTIASLSGTSSQWARYPRTGQLYVAPDASRIWVGLTAWSWDGIRLPPGAVLTGGEPGGVTIPTGDIVGVMSPDCRRALVRHRYTLFELSMPSAERWGRDTLDFDASRAAPFGAAAGAVHRWGTAPSPWISWARDGRRVLFNQGASLFIGDVKREGWTTFSRVDVPLTVPVDVPHGTLVLRGARLVTMRGHEVIERGDLVVQDNRVVAIGPMGHVTLPIDGRVFDVTGMTILPGYVDIHDHIFPPKGIHPQQSWQYLAWLASGVTATRDPAPELDDEVFAYRERERTGDIISPRLFSTGLPYYGTDPPIRTLDDARDAVRPSAEYFGSETFKIYYDRSTDRRARQFLAMAAAEQKLNATAHTNGLELELASVIDGLSGIEHAPTHPIYDDVATLIARSGTTQTHTYSGQNKLNYLRRRYGWPWEQPKMRRFVPPSMRATTCSVCSAQAGAAFGPLELDNLLPLIRGAAKIVARGGRVGMGAETNVPTLDIHYEMWLHGMGGMSNHDILRAATITGAEAIGHGTDLGTLEPGKLADLQVLEKNPLDDIHYTTSIRFVMKNGRLYQADDLTEIWPRLRPLAPLYLWERSSTPIVSRAVRRLTPTLRGGR